MALNLKEINRSYLLTLSSNVIVYYLLSLDNCASFATDCLSKIVHVLDSIKFHLISDNQ